jgi:predicted glycosyltransferase
LLPQHLNGASLANEIHELMRFQPRRMYFDLNGAVNAANLISQAALNRDFSAETVRPASEDKRPY